MTAKKKKNTKRDAGRFNQGREGKGRGAGEPKKEPGRKKPLVRFAASLQLLTLVSPGWERDKWDLRGVRLDYGTPAHGFGDSTKVEGVGEHRTRLFYPPTSHQ